jgi:predicted amino acid racemase
MNPFPRVVIDIDKIVFNFQRITERAHRSGIAVTGVLKGIAGDAKIANHLIEAGMAWIGDSRLDNLGKIKAPAGVQKMLLRLPAFSQLEQVVRCAGQSLNSEIEILQALNSLPESKGHEVFLMVDLGDLREGVSETGILELGRRCRSFQNLRISGIGTNFSCFAGLKPSQLKLEKLVKLANFLTEEYRLPIKYVSGGNSSSLGLLDAGRIPPGINHLRVGEGILLGRETLTGSNLPDLYHDAFIVEAEVIQAQCKPAVPDGETGLDAFGRVPSIPVQEPGIRLLLNLGHQDTPLTGLKPLDSGLTVLGGSSDYLVMASERLVKVGEIVPFLPNYWSLLGLMTSPYVRKVYRTANGSE